MEREHAALPQQKGCFVDNSCPVSGILNMIENEY